jgi:hypothetical protein
MENQNEKQLLTHSALSCSQMCKRKYYYRYILGLRRPERSEALYIGKMVHLGIELRFKSLNIWQDRFDWNCYVDKLIESVKKQAKAEDVPDMSAEQQAEYLKNRHYRLAKIEGILRAYYEYYRYVDEAIKVLEVEQKFRIPMTRTTDKGNTGYSRKFELAGMTDLVLEDPAQVAPCVGEHKTTSSDIDDPVYWQRLNVDNQISLYVRAANQRGIACQNVWYNVIRKPQFHPKHIPELDDNGLKIVVDKETGERIENANGKPRQTASTKDGFELLYRDETPQELMTRCRDEMLADPERYFRRQIIPRLNSDFEESERDYWFEATLISQCLAGGFWPRSTSACERWGRPCEYLDVCATGGYREGDIPMDGFEIVTEKHPELKETDE